MCFEFKYSCWDISNPEFSPIFIGWSLSSEFPPPNFSEYPPLFCGLKTRFEVLLRWSSRSDPGVVPLLLETIISGEPLGLLCTCMHLKLFSFSGIIFGSPKISYFPPTGARPIPMPPLVGGKFNFGIGIGAVVLIADTDSSSMTDRFFSSLPKFSLKPVGGLGFEIPLRSNPNLPIPGGPLGLPVLLPWIVFALLSVSNLVLEFSWGLRPLIDTTFFWSLSCMVFCLAIPLTWRNRVRIWEISNSRSTSLYKNSMILNW